MTGSGRAATATWWVAEGGCYSSARMSEPRPAPLPESNDPQGKAPSLAPTMIRQLRLVGLVEGVSFLLLLGVAMPLKYLAGLPQAVRLVGMAHGLLFLVYVAAALAAALSLRWPARLTLLVLGAAVVPLGPFLIDGRLKRQARGEA